MIEIVLIVMCCCFLLTQLILIYNTWILSQILDKQIAMSKPIPNITPTIAPSNK
jgi:hypothetical protein